ncbi:hypothetical protein DDE82_008747 [Stemphylium lycopersici]|nr:hypothetical protein DDE82_008747 [Stemphylium lycopersici]
MAHETGLAHIIPFDQPLPILTSPVVQAKAGEEIYYQNCPGDQIAKLRIPRSVPDGPAALEWQCSGANGIAVDLMVIFGGSGNLDKFAEESEAVRIAVECHANATDQSRTTCR